jgi:hypothetical protein
VYRDGFRDVVVGMKAIALLALMAMLLQGQLKQAR